MKKSILASILFATASMAATDASALGANTYTYLRCFYKVDDVNTKPKTNYVWARVPGSSINYYKLNGNWFKDGVTEWKNMFYTNVSQATMLSVCQSTFVTKGINRPVAFMAAADTAASLNYTAWSNDASGLPARVNKVVAFGDSVSDNQNLFNATRWVMPHQDSWFLGHFSNGKLWNEYLADSLKLPIYDWAVAGAAADEYYVIPGVSEQVDSYLAYMQSAPNYVPTNTLFTMMIGGNDLVNYGRTVDSIIARQQVAVEKLITSGARNILLLNVPDLSRAPTFAQRTDGPAIHAQLIDLNQRLLQLRDAMRAKYGAGLNIQVFDTYSKVEDIFNNPASYGKTNLTESCLVLDNSDTSNYAYAHDLRPGCTNPDTYVFWDRLHPTTHTHKIIGDSVTAFVKQNFTSVQ